MATLVESWITTELEEEKDSLNQLVLQNDLLLEAFLNPEYKNKNDDLLALLLKNQEHLSETAAKLIDTLEIIFYNQTVIDNKFLEWGKEEELAKNIILVFSKRLEKNEASEDEALKDDSDQS